MSEGVFGSFEVKCDDCIRQKWRRHPCSLERTHSTLEMRGVGKAMNLYSIFLFTAKARGTSTLFFIWVWVWSRLPLVGGGLYSIDFNSKMRFLSSSVAVISFQWNDMLCHSKWRILMPAQGEFRYMMSCSIVSQAQSHRAFLTSATDILDVWMQNTNRTLVLLLTLPCLWNSDACTSRHKSQILQASKYHDWLCCLCLQPRWTF